MADTNATPPQGPPYGYGPPTGEPTSGRTLRDYWRVLVQRRWVVYTCLITVVSVTMLLTFFTTPIYEAVTTIQIERQGPDILTHKDVMSADSSAYAYQDFYQTQYRILQSKSVVRIAVERLDLVTRPELLSRKPSLPARAMGAVFSVFRSAPSAEREQAPVDPTERAIGFVQGGLSVQPVRNSQLVSIAFRDRDPELARDIADAIAEAYVAFNYKNKYGMTELAREFLTKEVAQAQAEITVLQRKLQDYGDKKKILAVSEGSQDISEQALADFNRRYIEAKTRFAVAQARYDAVGARPDSLPEVLNSPLIGSLKQQHAEVERKYSQMAERFKEGWPPLMALRQELEQAKQRLEQETLGIAAQVQSVAQADYERAQREVANLERQVNGQKTEVQRVNRDGVEYAGFQAEIDIKRKILSDLMARQTQTSSSERLKDTAASNIRIVDNAEVPRAPLKPNKLLNFLLALVLGCGLGLTMAIVVDHLDNTIKTETDILRLSGIPVLGYLPLIQTLRAIGDDNAPETPISSTSQVDLASFAAPRSVFAEAFKTLRTSFLLASPSRPPRQIVVSSCEPQDGKSTVSVNLAIVLTQLGRRVLLIDADLRRPRLHHVLRLQNDLGLSSYLSGNATLDDVIMETEIPKLEMITSGPIPPNPSELLGSTALDMLLHHLESSGYDHVIFDSPPLLSVTDPVILATRMDATVIVVRAHKTSRESLTHAAGKLRGARASSVGAVLNAAVRTDSHYYYHYEYTRDDSESDPGRGRLRSTRRSSSRRRSAQL
jgi:capsular exopolysaccharide synthesis family protein